MTERDVVLLLSGAEIALGVVTAIALLFVSAPYGRHARKGWGPGLSARAGWMVMETPAVLGFLGVYLAGAHRAEVGPLVLLAMWQLHYVHRAFVFPFRMRASGKTMPASVALMGASYQVWNSYVNARWTSQFGEYPLSTVLGPRFLAGVALFLVGFAINTWADTVLLRLRKPGETGYRVPRGGLFELVACPNYLGEILEWTGWAIAAWSLPGLAFAIYTACNIGPRARTHLAWYREKLPDFPRSRKALIPFVW